MQRQKWVKQLHETVDFIDVRTQFGWTENMKSYVIGDKEIFANQTLSNPPGARTAQYFPFFASSQTLTTPQDGLFSLTLTCSSNVTKSLM